MKISIIVPAYNEEKKIKKCINSLIKQNYKQKEIIVINDGSIDKTEEILSGFEKRDKIILLNKKQNEGQWKGISDGQNIATGDIFMVFGADSYSLTADYLTNIVNWFSNKDIVAVGGIEISEEDNVISTVYSKLDYSFWPKKEVRDVYLNGGGLAIRKDILVLIGGYNKKAKWAEDADLNMKLRLFCKKNGKHTVLDPKLIISSEHPESIKEVFHRHFLWGFGRSFILKEYGLRSNMEILKILFIPLTISFFLIGLFNIFFLILTFFVLISPILYSIKKQKMLKLSLKEFFLLITIVYTRLIGSNCGTIAGFIGR